MLSENDPADTNQRYGHSYIYLLFPCDTDALWVCFPLVSARQESTVFEYALVCQRFESMSLCFRSAVLSSAAHDPPFYLFKMDARRGLAVN